MDLRKRRLAREARHDKVAAARLSRENVRVTRRKQFTPGALKLLQHNGPYLFHTEYNAYWPENILEFDSFQETRCGATYRPTDLDFQDPDVETLGAPQHFSCGWWEYDTPGGRFRAMDSRFRTERIT